MTGPCAYCREVRELTKEHAFSRWMPGKIPGSESISPVRGRHMFAGQLTIEDVCASCNNVRLSQLDSYAADWWDRNVRSDVTELHADEAKLGRWLSKIAYNMQRIEERERPRGQEGPIPEDAVRWIIGDAPVNGTIGICVGALPRGHHSALNAGHDGPRPGTPMPLRITHLLGLVFMTVWRDPRWAVSPAEMTRIICDTMPAVPLDLVNGKGPRQLPRISRPDFVEAGLYGNPDLRIRLTEHWRKQDAQGG